MRSVITLRNAGRKAAFLKYGVKLALASSNDIGGVAILLMKLVGRLFLHASSLYRRERGEKLQIFRQKKNS
jgi:hypothetical protein